MFLSFSVSPLSRSLSLSIGLILFFVANSLSLCLSSFRLSGFLWFLTISVLFFRSCFVLCHLSLSVFWTLCFCLFLSFSLSQSPQLFIFVLLYSVHHVGLSHSFCVSIFCLTFSGSIFCLPLSFLSLICLCLSFFFLICFLICCLSVSVSLSFVLLCVSNVSFVSLCIFCLFLSFHLSSVCLLDYLHLFSVFFFPSYVCIVYMSLSFNLLSVCPCFLCLHLNLYFLSASFSLSFVCLCLYFFCLSLYLLSVILSFSFVCLSIFCLYSFSFAFLSLSLYLFSVSTCCLFLSHFFL